MLKTITLKQICYYVFSLMVTASIFAYLFSYVSFGEVIELLHKIDYQTFFLFIVISLIGTAFRTWRYGILLRTSGKESAGYFALYMVTLVRNLFSDLLPARIGSLVYVYIINTRLGAPFGAALSSFAQAFIFDIIALALLIMSVALVVSAAALNPLLIVSLGAVLGVLSVVILYKMPIFFHALGKMIDWVAWIPDKHRLKWKNAVDSTAEGVQKAYEAGVYFKVFIVSLCVRLCKYFSLYVLLLALVHQFDMGIDQFPFSKVFLGLCTAEFAASLPISGIAGFGAYEGAWALVFELLGYTKQIAILTSISHHLITQVFGYTLGAAALIILMLPCFGPSGRKGDRYKNSETQSKKVMDMLRSKKLVLWMIIVVVWVAWPIGPLSIFTVPESFAKDKFSPELTTANRSIATNNIHYENNKLFDLLTRKGAKIVYQCRHGICKKEIGETKPTQLANNGTYPRWSPDGRWIAFVNANAIMRMDSEGNNSQVMVKASTPRAVAWSPNGQKVLFTDGKTVREVHIKTLAVETLVAGSRFLEIDIANSFTNRILAATVKTLFSFEVKIFNLKTGENRTIASGCSASLSPDGRIVTVNANDHQQLNLYWVHSGALKGRITAPHQLQFDNQFWSNSKDWIMSKSEGKRADIFIHRVSTDQALQVTFSGVCDRPDLYVNPD